MRLGHVYYLHIRITQKDLDSLKGAILQMETFDPESFEEWPKQETEQ